MTKNKDEVAEVKPGTVPPVESVDYSLHEDYRPLTGADLHAKFKGRYKLTVAEAAHALALATPAAYSKACKSSDPALPLAQEILVRIYWEWPSPPPWGDVNLAEAFQRLYGEFLEPFEMTDRHDDARIVLQNRFALCVGRTVFNTYRWLKAEGRSKKDVAFILAKVLEQPDPRVALEKVAKKVLRLRGFDLDAAFPIPTVSRPPKRHMRGRRPKVKDGQSAVKLTRKPPRGRVASVKKVVAKKAAVAAKRVVKRGKKP